MSHATKLESFLLSYNNSVGFGGNSRDESIHRAVDHAFPELKEVEKADLYSRIVEGFDEYDTTRMISRRMWLGPLLRNWQMQRSVHSFRVIRGQGPTAQEQQQATASGQSMSDDRGGALSPAELAKALEQKAKEDGNE